LIYVSAPIHRMRAIKPIHRTSAIVAKSIKLLLVSVGILLTGHGLQLTLLPVHARAIGWSDTEIGLTAAAYFFGFVLGCLSVPKLLSRAGHIRVFLTVAGLTAASLLMLEAIQLFPVWILLRLANGWCLAAIYTTAESWLNEHALDHQRARLTAIYVTVTLIAIASGQVLYGLLPANMLFTGAAVMMMLALIPVGLFCGDQPMALKQRKFRTGSIYALPPIARAGSFLSGVVTGSLWTMAPLIAGKNSLEASSVSSVMMAVVIGGGVFQLPLGYLADLIGRVRVITAASLACTLIAISGILVVPQNTGHLVIVMFLFGGTSLSLYALCAAEANAKSHLSRVEIATLFLLLHGAGSIIGPVMTGIVSNWTEAALYVVAALAMSMLLAYTALEGASIRRTCDSKSLTTSSC